MAPTTLPVIYSPRYRGAVGLWGRLLALGLGMGCLSVLLAALLLLRPETSGVGTHTQLGFQQCQFLQRTGLPCPSCGMTTSFALFVRGRIAASLWVQPFGTLLAIATAAGVWIGLYIAVTGRALHRLLPLSYAGLWLTVLLLLASFAWAWKIFVHLRGMDGWK